MSDSRVSLNSIKNDIKWIKEGIDELRESIKDLSSKFEEVRNTQISHKVRIELLEADKRRNEKLLCSVISGLAVGFILYIISLFF